MTPAPGARRVVVSKRLYPFAANWFEQGGCAVHYVDHGAGTPVVMLHGNPTWSFLYRDVIQRLGARFRCLAPDFPGFGLSEYPAGYGFTPAEHAAWLEAWWRALELPPCVLVVHDWGGPIGLYLASAHPERIAGLVIQNTWAWPAPWDLRLFSWATGGPHARVLHRRLNLFATLLPRAVCRRRSKPKAVFSAYRAALSTPDRREGSYVFARAIRQTDAWLGGIEAGLARLHGRPVELVWGMKDPGFGRERFIRRWQASFPDAGVTRLDDASHFLAEDRPDAIAAAIERVVARAGTAH